MKIDEKQIKQGIERGVEADFLVVRLGFGQSDGDNEATGEGESATLMLLKDTAVE